MEGFAPSGRKVLAFAMGWAMVLGIDCLDVRSAVLSGPRAILDFCVMAALDSDVPTWTWVINAVGP